MYRPRDVLPVNILDTIYKIVDDAGNFVHARYVKKELKQLGIDVHTNMLNVLLRDLIKANRIAGKAENCASGVMTYSATIKPPVLRRHPNAISWGLEQLLGEEYGKYAGEQSQAAG